MDDIAERIRALDVAVPATYRAFSELSTIEEIDGVPTARDMVSILPRSHEQVVRTGREVLALAQGAADESSAALVSDRMRAHEKAAWMLRAMQ